MNIKIMENSQKIYRNLQRRLDKLPIGFPQTESGVEIRILQHLFTPLEAQIAFHLSFIPEPVTKIFPRVKKLIATETELTTNLEKLVKKGAIIGHTTRDAKRVYSVTMLAIGMFEFQVNKLSKEFFKDFLEYLDEAFRDEVLNKAFPQLRPIPTEGSITPDLPILPYDDIRKLIPKLSNTILVTNCICKQGHDLLGEPCKVTDMREICIILGSGARNYHELGWGRYITKDELRDLLQKAEHDGLVVQPSNSKQPFCICLCCGDCCEVLTSAKKLENPANYFSSNYVAQVNEEICVGCQVCVSRCQMEAITMENKKATIDLSRCIGCGLCVPTCKAQAVSLTRKPTIIEPPNHGLDLYMNLLKHKLGNAKMILMLTRRLFKMKV